MNTQLILSARQFKRNNPNASHCLEKINGRGMYARLKEILESGDCVTSLTTGANYMIVRYYA